MDEQKKQSKGAAIDWYRYQIRGGWRKTYGHKFFWENTVFPLPSVWWQEKEYEAVMGREVPPNKEDWQFDYNPRSKKDRAKLREILDGR